MATLFMVATPIGNLEDITLRALRILKEVDVVFAEDTRVVSKLLSRYEIRVSLARLDANTEARGAEAVIERLRAGQNVAYVSDAGTPGVSDPGARLVRAVRDASQQSNGESEEITIEVIPGASSLTAAISVAGVDANEFLYLGFLPHKKGRKTALEKVTATDCVVVLFESTHRILKLLGELRTHVPAREVTIARELTKLHEEVLVGTPAELLSILTTTPVKQKGEFVVIIA